MISRDTPNVPQSFALFDLDGTLLSWDTQLVFCHFVLQRYPSRRLLLPIFLAFTPLAPWLGAQTMKRIFLCYLWKMPLATILDLSREFAQSVEFYLEILEKLEAERRAGKFIILTSASPSWYVEEIGKRLNVHLAIGSDVSPEPHLFRDVLNNKGSQKISRLHQLLPPACWQPDGSLPNASAYTDSTADIPLTEIAQHIVLVNPKPAFLAIREKNLRHSTWEIFRPTRPWKSTYEKIAHMARLFLGIGSVPW